MRATILLLALGCALALGVLFLLHDDRSPSAPPAEPAVPSVASPESKHVGPLRFAWPAEGRAVVRAEHRRNDVTTAETFDLEWRTLSSGMLLVETYRIAPEGARDRMVRSNWILPDQAVI